MAGRFPLLTDACVNDHLVQALSALGWDVVRAIDLYPERTKDEVLFARAAMEGRVFVTNDRPAEAIAIRWLTEVIERCHPREREWARRTRHAR